MLSAVPKPYLPSIPRSWTAAMAFAICLIVPPVATGTQAWADPAPGDRTAAGERGGAAPEGVPADWWGRVQKEIRDAEYEITWQSRTVLRDLDEAWHAPNRAQGFRTYFTDKGIRVVPRTEESPSWEWGLTFVGYGRAGRAWPVDEARLTAAKNRIEYDRGGIIEWYLNDPRGLEQSFELAVPPEEAGTGAVDREGPVRRTGSTPGGSKGDPAWLALALTGTLSPSISADGQSIDFIAPGGACAVRYAALRVTDARDREIPAWMEGFNDAGQRGIRLVFDDRDAVYPLSVDPLATSPAWMAEGDLRDSRFGTSVATAGDVNGDGYADVIVGANLFDNGQLEEGAAFVYHGSASGPSATANWTAEGNLRRIHFGIAVATAGDVNGDGHADVIVGANSFGDSEGRGGAAFVFHGSASGLSGGPQADPNDADWMAESDRSGAEFGYSVATAGDVNADGYADVVVGAHLFENGQPDEGAAFVYHGSASGLSGAPHADPNDADWTRESDQGSAQLGWSVATAGDVNADGYADLIIGAYEYENDQSNEGAAFVYHGSGSGLSTSPNWAAEGDQVNVRFGCSVGTAGDVNGDGYADVIVGAHDYENGQSDEGAAFVYHGSASGLSATADWVTESDQGSSYFGASVGTAGDVNGDGYADVIVGAYWYDNGQSDEGRAFVYHGSAAGLATSADWTAESDLENAFFGTSVATAGDVNGDGFADVIVGADEYTNDQTREGAAFVYLGSASGLAAGAGWTAESGQSGGYFGASVGTAGDVNGDGFADVVVGAHLYDNGEGNEGRAYVYHGSAAGLPTTADWTAEGDQVGAYLGRSVGTAGDVNGDGYSDLIVGAYGHDNVGSDEGRVYVYHGSASGLSASADWTADGDQDSAEYGYSVSTAGDVNGDSYADVIIGARYNDNFSLDGGAFVYHGSGSGLSASIAWSAETDQPDDGFGSSVSTAGDVNGDGYSDVIVGAPSFDNVEITEGQACVYHGSVTGLSPTPNWTAESNQYGARFGFSVSAAGDVNGDGFSDVIVGADHYGSDPNVPTGTAFVFHGSAGGLPPTANWTANPGPDPARFGYSVASAGDVNGDGYADVVVGAAEATSGEAKEGMAFVYHGSAAGLSTAADWTAESDQAGAQFGCSVGTAGDVNGDGYADLVVGAYSYNNGVDREGRAYLYYGNDGPGLGLKPRQRRADDSAPIGRLGLSESLDGFRLRALGRTPFGRGRIKLEWEVKPLGTLFDGTGTQVSTSWLDTGTAGAALNEVATGLSEWTIYHWRVRLLYDPVSTPFQRASRWFTVPWNGWQESDLRTAFPPCQDLDSDDFGLPGNPICPGGGQTDCNDADASVHPGADDVCDGLNNDCDHPSWPGLAGTNEYDDDGDTLSECAGDCEDSDPLVFPTASQICDGLNNDCDHPSWPGLAGTNEYDDDGDTLSECAGDCNDTNGQVWGTPGEVMDLFLDHDDPSVTTTITWNPPSVLGGTSVLYDTIMSLDPSDYVTGTTCVETNDSDTTCPDTGIPAAGSARFYFIRAENACPAYGGGGRPGRMCP